MLDNLIKDLISREGGYVNNPDDPGGETNMGISKRSYPHLDIKNLTYNQANIIYKRDFYYKYRIDYLPELLQPQVLDFTVNSGNTCIRKLQKLLGVKQDAVIGNITLTQLNKQYPNVKDQINLNNLLVIERLMLFRDIIRRRNKSIKFRDGWQERTLDFAITNWSGHI